MIMASSTEEKAARRRRTAAPVRSCAGCGQSAEAAELIRVVLGPEGEIAVDLAGGSFGRGAWLHPRPACIGRAAPRGLCRAFRCDVRIEPEALVGQIASAAEHRIVSLIGLSLRAGRLAVGGAAVEQALDSAQVKLLLLAGDARAAAELPRVARAAAAGQALVWGNKEQLGAAVRRSEVGVLGILDDGFAKAVSRAIGLAGLSRQVEVR
jgi:uncharacterized protein